MKDVVFWSFSSLIMLKLDIITHRIAVMNTANSA